MAMQLAILPKDLAPPYMNRSRGSLATLTPLSRLYRDCVPGPESLIQVVAVGQERDGQTHVTGLKFHLTRLSDLGYCCFQPEADVQAFGS